MRAAARDEAPLSEVAGRAALLACEGALPLANEVGKSGRFGRGRLPFWIAAKAGAFRFWGAFAGAGPCARDAALRGEGTLRCVVLPCGDNAQRGREVLLLLPATAAALRGEGSL